MFDFLNHKKHKADVAYDENAVNAEELGVSGEASEEETVYPELSFHPDWQLEQEDEYVYRFWNKELPPLKPNQFSIHGVDLKQLNGTLVVEAFVRNSLSRSINLKTMTILLLDQQGFPVARKWFDLKKVGTVPAKSSRPWTFTFEKQHRVTADDNPPVHGWKLVIEPSQKHRRHTLDLDESLEHSLPAGEAEKLERYVEGLQPPKPGEINFVSLKAEQKEGALHVALLIRNGSDRSINLPHLPLQVEDATGDVVAQGAFKLEHVEVKGNTSKPWTFVFPESMILSETIDLSRWKAYPIH
ncbi:accessory Sec system S-layer assembly protein [Halobacillus sp. K22]|uniref:accessory Sec system S-layer assembly protein n=1 Tax=Halobacillus sp. K22 TaxID=3457431 RepID=UPI003FCD3FBC